jgi:predicted PurR-regulated permease PerM
MRIARPAAFWIVVCAVSFVMLVLLRQILLPFVVGALLAYLLVPAVDRLERFGINRSLAALGVLLPLIAGLIAFLLVMLPALIGEVRFFVDEFPRYITRLQSLMIDAGRPWLHRVMGGANSISSNRPLGIAKSMSTNWVDGFLRSLWSSGVALVSLLSLLIVTPVIAIYLAIDWHRMIATVDGWFPPSRRDDMRALGREIHETVAGFVRGQVVICLVLAVLYATALKATGLNHAILIGITAGLISFVPYLGPPPAFSSRPALRWPNSGRIGDQSPWWGHLHRRRNACRLCAVATPHRSTRQPQPGLDDVCAVRLWMAVRLHWACCWRYLSRPRWA